MAATWLGDRMSITSLSAALARNGCQIISGQPYTFVVDPLKWVSIDRYFLDSNGEVHAEGWTQLRQGESVTFFDWTATEWTRAYIRTRSSHEEPMVPAVMNESESHGSIGKIELLHKYRTIIAEFGVAIVKDLSGSTGLIPLPYPPPSQELGLRTLLPALPIQVHRDVAESGDLSHITVEGATFWAQRSQEVSPAGHAAVVLPQGARIQPFFAWGDRVALLCQGAGFTTRVELLREATRGYRHELLSAQRGQADYQRPRRGWLGRLILGE